MSNEPETGESAKPERRREGYPPEQAVQFAPLFEWWPRPLALLKFLFGFPGYLYLLPWTALYVAVASASWVYLTPDMNKVQDLSRSGGPIKRTRSNRRDSSD